MANMSNNSRRSNAGAEDQLSDDSIRTSYVSHQRTGEDGEVDEDGLPLVYNSALINSYWGKNAGAVTGRWSDFLGVATPWIASAFSAAMTGRWSEEERSLAKDAVKSMQTLGLLDPPCICQFQCYSEAAWTYHELAVEDAVVCEDVAALKKYLEDLANAARLTRTNIIRCLLKAGAGTDCWNHDGMTALNLAAVNGHLEVARLLLEAGADTNCCGRRGQTALMLAAYNGHLRVARLLLEASADKDCSDDDSMTVLMLAAEKGHLEVARLLLEAGADKNCCHDDGRNVLMLAADAGRLEDGKTALMRAADKGHLEVARVPPEASAEKNCCDDFGMTSLMLAASNGHLEVLRLLLEAGAEKDAWSNYDGRNALMLAAEKGHLEVARLLLEAGADKDCCDDDGKTVLMLADFKGHVEVAHLLRVKQRCQRRLQPLLVNLLAAQATFSTEEARAIIEKELGKSVDEVFSEFSAEPVAAASLAQVYKAKLKETGDEVAVKEHRASDHVTRSYRSMLRYVMRKAAAVTTDLASRFTSQLTDWKVLETWGWVPAKALVEVFGEGLYTELDFRNEALNQQKMKKLIASEPRCSRVMDYTTRRVLVSQWVDGTKLTNLSSEEILDGIADAQECFLHQLLTWGFFHGDPHPGNLLLINSGPDEGKLAGNLA
ncbi:ANKRD50 [Symbiodinium sp. KB8]|nr:ANKRD50 [Symbiodinium sp. KB8]